MLTRLLASSVLGSLLVVPAIAQDAAQKQLEHDRRMFALADHDPEDGVLTGGELTEVLREFDLNGDGVATFGEYRTLKAKWRGEPAPTASQGLRPSSPAHAQLPRPKATASTVQQEGRSGASVTPGRYLCEYLVFGYGTQGMSGMMGRTVFVHTVYLKGDGTYAVQGASRSGRYAVSNGQIRWTGGLFGGSEYRAEIPAGSASPKFILLLNGGKKDGERLNCIRQKA